MAYGSVNVPGVSISELEAVKKIAEDAKKTADDAQEAVSSITNVINTLPVQSNTLTYNGQSQSPKWNGYSPDIMDIEGAQSGTNAGNYSVEFIPKKGYQWWDETSEGKTVQWSIGRQNTATPTQSTTLIYTGAEQSPTWSGYDTGKMTLGGTTSASDAGSYNATFTPKDNYQFSDGQTTEKTVPWKINKAAGSLTLDKNSITLSGGITTATVNVTRTGDGAISASSNDANTATVKVEGTKITVTGVASGDATITVKVAAGTNHNAPANGTIAVNVRLPSAILAENSPDIIKEVAQSGQAANFWDVGDMVPIKLNGLVGELTFNDETYYAFIIGFDHNKDIEGDKSIHFQFGKTADGTDIAFVDRCYNSIDDSSKGFCMNNAASTSNSGGWTNSYMRKAICPAFLFAIPAEWQNIITACTKYSDNMGGGNDNASCVTATQDKIWLLAEWEVFGARASANSAEQNYQQQYDFYKNGNKAIKYSHNNTRIGRAWWIRSVTAKSTLTFCYVTVSGAIQSYFTYYSLGFAPGFKVS